MADYFNLIPGALFVASFFASLIYARLLALVLLVTLRSESDIWIEKVVVQVERERMSAHKPGMSAP